LSEAHPAALAEQFEDLEQQHEAASLGMWVFLATELMFFGGLFTGYAIYRGLYFPGFKAGSELLNIKIGALNTAILICSSLTMALAVRAATLGKRRALMAFLVLTILLGLTFLSIKLGVEWYGHYMEQLAPGINFVYKGPNARSVELFFVFYFFMTGVHALHMVVGVSILAVLAWQAFRGRFGPEHYNPVEMAGLYWHFVDIIWIFLYPLLYLIGAYH
jgi:cytochrome c oxidase subunit 3